MAAARLPSPFAAAFAVMARVLAALVEEVGGTGRLWLRGEIPAALAQTVLPRLRRAEAETRRLLKALAHELAATLTPRARPAGGRLSPPPLARRSGPQIRALDGPLSPAHAYVTRPLSPPPAPDRGWGPRILAFDGPSPTFAAPERSPEVAPFRVVLFPATGPQAARRAAPPPADPMAVLRDVWDRYYAPQPPPAPPPSRFQPPPEPEPVPARPLAARVEALVRALENPLTIARRLARRIVNARVGQAQAAAATPGARPSAAHTPEGAAEPKPQPDPDDPPDDTS
jgi:hypothetical protein